MWQGRRAIRPTSIGGARAFYDVGSDYVQVPPQPAFTHQIDFYRTALHELGHWTGHASRLDRDQTGSFGSKPYGHEELIAEMAGAFVCAALGIAPTVRHADYIGSWLEIIREDHEDVGTCRRLGVTRLRGEHRHDTSDQ